jgi:NAD(P)-dependent dehydrogenase (short-subunit alcohol dehydrogenase family)
MDGAEFPTRQERPHWVTGANSGIGFSTALKLCRAGAKVVVASRDAVKGIGHP